MNATALANWFDRGMNPLLKMAHPLLVSVLELKDVEIAIPIESLRQQWADQVEIFRYKTESLAIDKETVTMASYCLCTFLDEILSATSWGANGAWAKHSLLVMFHGDASGGERFFSILAELSERPGNHIDALELISVMLALGMQGRYRLIDQGHVMLESIRGTLQKLIQTTRNSSLPALSAPWKSKVSRRSVNAMAWASVGLIGALAMLYASLNYRLSRDANQMIQAFSHLPFAQAPSTALPSALGRWAQQLQSLLAVEATDNILDVAAKTDRATITLHSDALFASGSAIVLPAQRPLVQRLSSLLHGIPGRIMVIGYTDDQATAPGGPSNWQLSAARASSIVSLLRTADDPPDRFLMQGRGDTEPVASNRTQAGRARNRRVVITLLAPGAAA